MQRRDPQEQPEGDLPEIDSKNVVRRGRRFTPPGQPFQRARPDRRRGIFAGASVQVGDVIAELTPRQAVVWLLNLETMLSLYETTTEHRLSTTERDELVVSLRQIVSEKGLR